MASHSARSSRSVCSQKLSVKTNEKVKTWLSGSGAASSRFGGAVLCISSSSIRSASLRSAQACWRNVFAQRDAREYNTTQTITQMPSACQRKSILRRRTPPKIAKFYYRLSAGAHPAHQGGATGHESRDGCTFLVWRFMHT